MKSISWSKSKLVLFGSVLFLSSFFFGGQAKAAPCFWTAGSAANYSSTTAWHDAGGTVCDPSANPILFKGVSSTASITFDVSTTTQGISFDSDYTGIATISSGITVTTTGGFTTQASGVTGAFTIASGATLAVGTNLNVSSTASFNVGGNLKLGGNLAVTTTLNSSATTNFYFTSTTAQTVSGPGNITFANLDLSLVASTVTLFSSVTTTGNVVLGLGSTLALGTNNLVTAGEIYGGGRITQSAGTVTMTGSNKQLGGDGGITFYNLIINGSEILSGNVTTTNNLTVDTGKSLNLSSYNVVASGTFSNLGTVTQTSGSVTMSGTGNLGGTGNTTLSALTITGTTTLAGNVTSTNVLTNNGVLIAGSNTIILTGSGTVFVPGTFNAGTGIVDYKGTSNVASTTYYTLESEGTQTLVGNATTTNGLTVTVTGAFAQSSGTFVISGAGLLQNTGGNLTLFNLNIATNTLLYGGVTTTNVLTVSSGKIFDTTNGTSVTLAATGTPFVINGTFTPGSVNVIYSGATANVAPTTYYDLTINSSGTSTITSSTDATNNLTVNSGKTLAIATTTSLTGNLVNSGTVTATGTSVLWMTGASKTLGGSGTTNLYALVATNSTTLSGNLNVSFGVTIPSNVTLNAGGSTITLSGTGTPLSLTNAVDFVANTSTIIYSGATANIATTTFYNLTLSSGGTYGLSAIATSTHTFTNNGTFNVGAYNLIIPSGTYTNNATTTMAGAGRIKMAATGGFTATTYTSGSANGTGNTISISVTDSAANLIYGVADANKTVTVAATPYSDSESVTLTETSNGIFTGSIPFNITSAAASNSKVDVSGNGTLSLAYTNDYGALTGTGISASYTGSTFSSGGGSSGVSAPSVSSPTGAVSVTSDQTTSQVITLNLSATNATQVAISEDPGFAGASWDTYAPTKSFTLSAGAGEKTIYVKFRSASGGVTATYKANITLKPNYVPSQVITPAVSTSGEVVTPVVTAVTQFVVSNPDSKIIIAPVKTLVYKPNSVVKYTYSYKNETTKTVKVKIVRSVVDANGKVITKVTGSASIAKGKTYKFNASSPLSNKVAEGNYTVKVQVLDFKKGTLIDENSFGITVKKPLPPPTITSTNPDSKVVITGLKVDYKVGSAVKYTYSYKNESGKPLKVKIVRQVVDENGKILTQVAGTRTLSKGTTFKFNATSALSKKLAVGTYTVKVQVLDSKNVVLDENGFDFIVKK